ncbi:MAG: hypothetical protein EAX90_11090 [Candidatus Heimdallarchaeota archaeon]|nr:hypothetical protein [Candidatus Heimdallarchaeota archaeon]
MNRKIENLEVKYKERKESEEILKRINEIFKIETRHAIIMAINTFGSSNIKKLAMILGKNEATIYYHIKELTKKPELIQIDQEATHSHKGIFYKLTDLSKKYFSEPEPEKMEDIFTQVHNLIEDKTDEEVAKFYYELLAKNPDLEESTQRDKRRLSYYRILENFMISNLERIGQAVINGAKPKNARYPIGSISISSIDMKISTPKQLFEILLLISEMFGKLSRLQEKFNKQMQKEKISDDDQIAVHYHVVGGEVAEFELE